MNYVKLLDDDLIKEIIRILQMNQEDYFLSENDNKRAVKELMLRYHSTLDSYQKEPTNQNQKRLQKLTFPINMAMDFVRNGFNHKHPAADEILSHIFEYGKKLEEEGHAQEKSYSRKLTNASAPSIINDDDFTNQINGFSLAVVIIGITILLGSCLGALLFIIK